jgi:hypothetical protein
MTVTLNLPPEIEKRVQTEAARQSLGVEEYLLRLVETAVPDEEEAARRERALHLLRSVSNIGDEQEQKETFDYLKAAVDADRLSERKRFA